MERLAPAEALRLPHIGWNDVRPATASRLYAGLEMPRSFYFVHSYAIVPDDPAVATGMCEYGGEFVASVEHENICGVQFHPEKSHTFGLALLRNWVASLGAPC